MFVNSSVYTLYICYIIVTSLENRMLSSYSQCSDGGGRGGFMSPPFHGKDFFGFFTPPFADIGSRGHSVGLLRVSVLKSDVGGADRGDGRNRSCVVRHYQCVFRKIK